MHILQSYITVKPSAELERAVAEATEVTDCDVPESFLDSLSTDYPSLHSNEKKTTVVENLDEQNK